MFVFRMLPSDIILKYLSLAIILISSTTLYSQSHTVSGAIKDQQNQPVAYANVVLLKSQDSTAVSGTTSDEEGLFEIAGVSEGNYIAQISFIGYKTEFRNLEINGDQNLGTIILEESAEALSQIDIIVKKPTLRREADRLVFSVEQTALSEGNMMDLLRNTPSVLVLNDEITVRNITPDVYINDRKVHLSSSEIAELLQGTSCR